MLTLERDLDCLSGLAAEQAGDADLARKYRKAAAATLDGAGMHSYFQALAVRHLVDEEAAQKILTEIAGFAAEKRSCCED